MTRGHGNENKWLHRRAMREHLPVSVATRMSKAEFSVVFTRQWDDLSRHVINDVLPRRSAWANPSQFRKLIKGASVAIILTGRKECFGRYLAWIV